MEEQLVNNEQEELEALAPKHLNKKAIIQLFDIDKVYPNGVQAVFGFHLDVYPKEFVVLVGPSGCGKSTTLRMIAGLEEITYGQLYINQKLSNFVESKDRNIAMVFQNYALYPNMTVYENIAFGLKIRKTPKEEIEKRVFEAARILDLGKYLDRKPKELSGGQMQRVALGRAIVRHAPIFLMDEPLSNLDAKLRVSMRSEIVKIHNTVGSTTIYVTHDQIEAMTMATKIVVMNKGFIQQVGKPNEIYSEPANSFVATFIGTPAMNTFTGKYEDGKISIDEGVIFKDEKLKKAHDSYLESVVDEISRLLVDFGFEGASYLRRMLSNRITMKETERKEEIKHKESFFSKIGSLFKKKNKEKVDPTNDSKADSNSEEQVEVNPLKEELSANLELIKKEQEGVHDILIGIRPEKIKLRKIDKDTKAKIKVTAEIVELLGADYNIHFKLQGTNIVAKMDNTMPIEAGDEFEVILNEKDIYLFDYITGKRYEY